MWKCECPRCGHTEYSERMDNVIVHNNHDDGCEFYYKSIRTTFDAFEVKGIELLVRKVVNVIKS